jgi:hypothetical protein
MTNTISTLYVTLGVSISAFLAIAGLIGMAIATHLLRRRYKNAEWAPTPGTIEHSEISLQRGGRGSVMFTPVIRYSYSYEGSQYESSVISPDLRYARSNKKSDATKWTTLFPKGGKVTAYLDKRNPDVAVLFPDFRYGWWHVFLVTFAVFGGSNFLWLILMVGLNKLH